MATITADSVPDYDNWGPDDYWTCDDWVLWHKLLKQKYGKKSADSTWTTAWNKQDSFEHNYNWCKYEGVFNKYVQDENLNATWWLPNILNSATTVVENAGDTAVNASKIIKWVIPVLVIGAAVGILIYAAKKFKLV